MGEQSINEFLVVRFSLVSESHVFCICVYALMLVFGVYVYEYIIWVAIITCIT